EEAVKSPSNRFNEFLVRAQTPRCVSQPHARQRSCPGSLQQIRQCCDHREETGSRAISTYGPRPGPAPWCSLLGGDGSDAPLYINSDSSAAIAAIQRCLSA